VFCSGWDILRGTVLPGASESTRVRAPVLFRCQHHAAGGRQHQGNSRGNACNLLLSFLLFREHRCFWFQFCQFLL